MLNCLEKTSTTVDTSKTCYFLLFACSVFCKYLLNDTVPKRVYGAPKIISNERCGLIRLLSVCRLAEQDIFIINQLIYRKCRLCEQNAFCAYQKLMFVVSLERDFLNIYCNGQIT